MQEASTQRAYFCLSTFPSKLQEKSLKFNSLIIVWTLTMLVFFKKYYVRDRSISLETFWKIRDR